MFLNIFSSQKNEDLRNKNLTIEAPPQTPRYLIRKQTFLTIGSHDTNRAPTLYEFLNTSPDHILKCRLCRGYRHRKPTQMPLRTSNAMCTKITKDTSNYFAFIVKVASTNLAVHHWQPPPPRMETGHPEESTKFIPTLLSKP